jgi:hypothetical protein
MIKLSKGRAAGIGWTLLAGPVATAVYSITSGLSPALFVIGTALVCAALFLLAVGYSWIIVGPGVRVEGSESTRSTVLDERACRDDVRTIDVLVTQSISVRWFVQRMAEMGKDVRLFVHDPELTSDPAQRARCVGSLYDIVTSLNPSALKRLRVYAYNLTPSVRALILRDAIDHPLFASLGWYSYLDNGVGGSRYPAIVFGAETPEEQLLMKFADNEVKEKAGAGRLLSQEEIVRLFDLSKRSLDRSVPIRPQLAAEQPDTQTGRSAC